MTITLTWDALNKLAANGSVDINGTTVKIERPIRSFINMVSDNKPDPFVSFALDMTDHRARQ